MYVFMFHFTINIEYRYGVTVSSICSTYFQGVIAEVPDIILRCVSRDEAGLAVAQKVYYSFVFPIDKHTVIIIIC